jgi:predicted Zn-dependent protease
MPDKSSGIILLIIIILSQIFLSACSPDKQDNETLRLYAQAQAAYGAGQFSKAAGLLKGCGDFPPALVLRGKSLFLSDEIDDAEKSLRRALRLRPESPEASIFLARILREKNKDTEAEKLVQAVISGDPQNIRALRLLADLSADKGEAGKAAASAFLDRAIEASSESALVFIDRARLRWIGGNAQGALDDLNRAKLLLSHENPLSGSIEKLEKTIVSAIALNLQEVES